MSTSSTTHVRVTLNLERVKILLLLAGARIIYNGMLANVPLFPAPIPTLGVLLAQITALDLAQQAVATRAVGAVARRNQARDTLWESLQSLRVYVQGLANAAGDGAVALVKDAGMNVASSAARHKPLLQAKLGSTSGQVQLLANATILRGGSKQAVFYHWQYSLDGGHTWVVADSTAVANTTLSGLPRLTLCMFQVAITKGGVMGSWSSSVQLTMV